MHVPTRCIALRGSFTKQYSGHELAKLDTHVEATGKPDTAPVSGTGQLYSLAGGVDGFAKYYLDVMKQLAMTISSTPGVCPRSCCARSQLCEPSPYLLPVRKLVQCANGHSRGEGVGGEQNSSGEQMYE